MAKLVLDNMMGYVEYRITSYNVCYTKLLRVKQEVRERIEKIIEETGYMPSDVAKGLKDRKTNLIGVIIPRLNFV